MILALRQVAKARSLYLRYRWFESNSANLVLLAVMRRLITEWVLLHQKVPMPPTNGWYAVF